MRIILAVGLVLLCSGCATTIEYGKIVDGKQVPDEYIKIKGVGRGEFPSGHKGEGRPMIQFPNLPPVKIEQ